MGVCAATGAVILAGCGSSAHFANKSRPATPVDLTVYVNDARVSVSPASVGAGPVIFFVTNQASHTEQVEVRRNGSTLATTGPINPQSTAQVTVDFNTGDYTIATSGGSAGTVLGPTIRAATLHIGAPRPDANSALLQP